MHPSHEQTPCVRYTAAASSTATAVAAGTKPAAAPSECPPTPLQGLVQTHIWDKHPRDGQAGGDGERHAAAQHDGFICVGPHVLHWERAQAHEITSAHALTELVVLLCWLQSCTRAGVLSVQP